MLSAVPIAWGTFERCVVVLGAGAMLLVADAAADAVAVAELGHCKAVTEGIAHEWQSLIHSITLLPRHHSLPVGVL
jgi:hypothetical protein